MNLWHAFVAFVSSRQWMPVAILVIGYLVRLTSNQSPFPVAIPARWRPLAVLALGQGYAVLLAVQSGAAWGPAALHGLETAVWTMGLFDVVVNAVWGGQEPAWVAWLIGAVKTAIPQPDPGGKRAFTSPDPDHRKECASCTTTWWTTDPNAQCPACDHQGPGSVPPTAP